MARGRTRLTGLVPRLLYFYASISFALCGEYGIPIEIKVWDSGRTPLAQMVDITNGFGLKVLAEHNFLNDNNIAFSPYGLMGILVALYEGVDGESSYQIQRAMQLPWNRNVMRIGFRDIHRTLKTYFVPEEGFLAGLALNNENVTFNESYKKILRFYGFDLDNDQIPTMKPESNHTMNSSTTTQPSSNSTAGDIATTISTTITTEAITERENPGTMSTKEETTINPDSEVIGEIDPRGQTSSPPTPSANAESTTMLVTAETSFQSTTNEQNMNTITAGLYSSTPITPPTVPEMTTTIPISDTTIETTTAATTSNMLTGTTIDNDILSTREVTFTPSDLTTVDMIERSTVSTMQTTDPPESSTMREITVDTSTPTFTETDATESNISTGETMQTDSTTESPLETLDRRKRSFVDYAIFTKPPVIDDYLIYRSYDIPPEPVGSDLNTNKMFLVNGLRNVQVTYMHYDTVLEHAYLPHLEASALRLPLDSERYYLLVLLPARGDPARLLARMARGSDLADVHAALRPRRVRALVPSFTIKGHVTLTTDLQKLGIRDVFEPRQHDFTPMTRQAGVYVRSIEQAVSVAIRKYQPDDPKKNRYVSNRNQVVFSATYPFLYFVMDSNIHVALMAGKMVDPLNSRIL